MDKMETYKIWQWVRVVLILLAVFLLVEALGSFKDLHSVSSSYNSISVTGEGEVIVVPDIANFSFTVSADAATVSEAQEKVTEKMNVILAELKELGIEEKDIKTSDYSVYPRYSFDTVVCSSTFCPPTRQKQDGYTANHSISVKVRNTEDAGMALTLVGDNGATGLSDISFTIDDPDKVVEEARAEAIKNAKDKAKILSKELGVRLVRVVSFYDNDEGVPYFAEGLEGDRVKSSVLPIPDIPTGENKVKVNVTVTYEIR